MFSLHVETKPNPFLLFLLSCRSLEVLRLDGNALLALPSGLSALTSLRELHAANNKLQQLPRVLEPLQKLEVLQVGVGEEG
jgi:Leucine-rich repeat (LRR) protein